MNEQLALRVLGEIMGWSDAEASEEFRWLSLMARMKYDGYQGFRPGVRFLESLAAWMQQFHTQADRAKAYAFVRSSLVYVGPPEILRLVELLYPAEVQPTLVQTVADDLGIPPYRVWATPDAEEAYKRLLRGTLFIGLSDGARLDLFRRTNVGIISNEQVVGVPHVDDEKWDDMLQELRRSTGQGPNARFAIVYLIDDFVGTGTTFIRKDTKSGKWKGKLRRFRDTLDDRLEKYFEPDLQVRVHHYIANYSAVEKLRERQAQALAELGTTNWFPNVDFSFGTVLPADLPINKSSHSAASEFVELTERYYDPSIETRHSKEGGTDLRLGFSACALPLILEHNTPNNSVGLLWAESEGADSDVHQMRPLFYRRDRHTA